MTHKSWMNQVVILISSPGFPGLRICQQYRSQVLVGTTPPHLPRLLPPASFQLGHRCLLSHFTLPCHFLLPDRPRLINHMRRTLVLSPTSRNSKELTLTYPRGCMGYQWDKTQPLWPCSLWMRRGNGLNRWEFQKKYHLLLFSSS